MKTNRRDFLKKSGLVLGASAMIGTAAKLSLPESGFDQSKLENQEQVQLLTRFDQWVNDYLIVINDEKKMNREFKDNQALTTLPDQMEKWMPELKKHLNDKSFATEYLKIADRLTQAIDSQF